MKLSETTLVKILRNEGNMEAYLRQYETNCSLIDPVIWKIHLSAPVRKRMNVLNRFLGQLLNKYSMIFSFLPKPLVLARVYKKLHIPFSVNPSRMSSIEVSLRRIPKTALLMRYSKIYNSLPKPAKKCDLGIYEYNEHLEPFISYSEFQMEYRNRNNKSDTATSVQNEPKKHHPKKLSSNFSSKNICRSQQKNFDVIKIQSMKKNFKVLLPRIRPNEASTKISSGSNHKNVMWRGS